jgi:SNF2 family DNA or RNA helicase
MAPSKSPNGVECIDLTGGSDDASQQQNRLGEVRRTLSPSERKRKREERRASLKTTGLENKDVISLLDDSDDDEGNAKVSSDEKKPKIEGDTKVKREGQKPAARAASLATSLATDGLEVVEPSSIRDRMVAAAPSATNDDDDVVLEGVVNEVRLPHLRQDCTTCSFMTVRMGYAAVSCPQDALEENEKSCDLCYCYVCDCPVKDCKKWRSQQGSRNTNQNHCCAVNDVGLWQQLRKQEKNTAAAPAAAAAGGAATAAATACTNGQNQNDPPEGYHFSYFCPQRLYSSSSCSSCWCFVCDREGSYCFEYEHRQFGHPNYFTWQQERAKRKLSTYGKSGPFSPNNADAAKDTSLTKCRHCSWFSRLELIANRECSSDDWCHSCGLVASAVDLSKNQATPPDEVELKEMYFFGEKQIPFRIHAHDPRKFDRHNQKWANNPAWHYDEADREEEVFQHIMGGSPKFTTLLEKIAYSSEDKIPESGEAYEEMDETDAILIDDPSHVNLISILNSGANDCLVTKASWNKQLRAGVLNIQLWFPKSFLLGNYRNISFSEFQSMLPVVLATWFGCNFEINELSGLMKPSKKDADAVLENMTTNTITLPFGSTRAVHAKAQIPPVRQLLASRKDDIMAARDALESSLSLSPSDGKRGGVSPSETSFQACLLRYFQEHFPKLIEDADEMEAVEELIGITAGQIRREPCYGSSDMKKRNMDCLVGYADSVIAMSLLSNAAEKATYSDSMTTKEIMACVENLGHASEAFVEGLNVELLDFQKQALKWAVEREQTPGGIQSFYWAKLPDREGQKDDLYFNPVLGQFRKDKPTIVRGGILAQEMGLGKTVISLSLILKNPAPTLPQSGSEIAALSNSPKPTNGEGWDKSLYGKTSKDNAKRGSVISRGTLVVCPVSLVGQWIEEAKSRLKDPGLVYPYHGQNRTRDAKKLAKAAIVVTTYQILASDDTYHRSKGGADYCPPVEQVRWWRIIADEGHSLKEGSTNRNHACQSIVADHKWIVTGTPMSGNPKEMKNLLKFIGIEESDKMFSNIGSAQIARERRHSNARGRRHSNDDSRHAELLMFLLRPILLRHSQEQKYRGTPNTLMSLPPMTKRTIEVTFSSVEKKEFGELEKAAQDFYLHFRGKHVHDMSKHFLKVNAKLQPMRIASAGGKYPLVDTSAPIEDADDDMSDDENEEDVENASKKKKKVVQYSKFVFESKAKALIAELARIRDNEPDSKSLIFSQFTSTLEHLQELLPQHGFSFRTLKVCSFTMDYFSLHIPYVSDVSLSLFLYSQGNMSMKLRAKALHDFQNDPPTTVFLLSMRYELALRLSPFLFASTTHWALSANALTNRNPRSGAVGINLTQANRVFLMEPGFNPSLELQAIGRVHRLGQKRSVEICRLVMKDSFESRMVQFLKKKYGLTFDEAEEKKGSSASEAGGSGDGDEENKDSNKVKKSLGKPVNQLVGNLQSEKAQIMTEEFDELFGVQDRVAASASSEGDAGTNQNSINEYDNFMPD